MMEKVGDNEVPMIVPIMAGGTSSMVTRCISQPLDVVKIRMQLQVEPICPDSKTSKYRGFSQAFQTILREEGLRGFWKGHIPAQVVSFTCGLVQFGLYDYLTKSAKTYRSLADKQLYTDFASGFLSGSLATFLSYPFDTVRTRIVSEGGKSEYKSVRHGLFVMYKKEGAYGFYRGLTPALVQVGCAAGLHFSVFYALKRNIREHPFLQTASRTEKFIINFSSGALSGVVSKFLLYPLDLSEKRMQLQSFREARTGYGENFTCKSLLECLVKTARVEGPRALYKGLLPSLMKSTIVSGLTFAIYEPTYVYLQDLYQV